MVSARHGASSNEGIASGKRPMLDEREETSKDRMKVCAE